MSDARRRAPALRRPARRGSVRDAMMLPLFLLLYPRLAAAKPCAVEASDVQITTVAIDAPVGSDSVAEQRLIRIERLRHSVDSIWSVVRDSARRRHSSAFFDTLRAGLFQIATSSDLRTRVETAARAVTRDLVPVIDGAAAAAIGNRLVLVRHAESGEHGLFNWSSLVVTLDDGAADSWSPVATGPRRLEVLEHELRRIANARISRSLDDPLNQWLYHATISWPRPSAALEERARLDVATAESNGARQCMDGETTACARLLSLHGHPADPLAAWYAPRDFRGLVRRFRAAASDGPNAPVRQQECLSGIDASCAALLRTLAADRIPPPVLESPRLLLLHEALRIGGTGAVARLRTTEGDIGARLSAASGVSEGELLARWRSRVTAAVGARARPSADVTLGALGWIVLLTGLSLRRSRRCD